jgi:hypothetical protein
MALTLSQQAAFDYLIAGPGVHHRVSPPGQRGWVAFTSSGGGGADPGTVEFRKTRGFGDCELHYAAFRTTGGQEQWLLSRTWRRPGGDWAARAVTFPASVQILGRDGTVLAAYEEFAEFAD